MKTKILGAAILLMAALVVPAAAAPATDGKPSASVAVFTEFDTTLQPGELHGFVMGISALDRAYYAEVTPLEPSSDGAFIERNVIEPEFDGSTWNDVLRLQIPAFMAELDVHVRVYSLAPRR